MRTKNAAVGDSLPQSAPKMPPATEEFYRKTYPRLLRYAIFVASGNVHDAEDAVSAALLEVCSRWEKIENPAAYARRVIINNLSKGMQGGLRRTCERQIQRGDYPRPSQDPNLTVWEDWEWVMQLLRSLPPAQRKVLACMIDEASTREIAELLGKTDATVRQNLHAARTRLKHHLAQRGGPMSVNDLTSATPDGQEALKELLGEVLDLGEQVVSQVTEEMIEQRLQGILGPSGALHLSVPSPPQT
jgi:RNA polymerase sigma factor (sigma-70 family)